MIACDVCLLIVGGRCLCYFVLIWKATRHHLWCWNNLNLCDRHGKPSILLNHPTIWESYRAKERELCLGLLLSRLRTYDLSEVQGINCWTPKLVKTMVWDSHHLSTCRLMNAKSWLVHGFKTLHIYIYILLYINMYDIIYIKLN